MSNITTISAPEYKDWLLTLKQRYRSPLCNISTTAISYIFNCLKSSINLMDDFKDGVVPKEN